MQQIEEHLERRNVFLIEELREWAFHEKISIEFCG